MTAAPTYVLGIDVSHYQGDIDWHAVAASGVKFAYIKATEGVSYVDPSFAQNVAGAQAAGMLVGAYHFLTAGNIVDQADRFNNVAGQLDLPMALDVEELVDARDVLGWFNYALLDANAKQILYCDPARAQSLTAQLLTAQLLTAARPQLADYPLWIAEYGVNVPRTAPWTRWAFWQHTEGGHIPGIRTPVDLDHFNGDLAALRAFAGLSPAVQPGIVSSSSAAV